MRWLLFVMLLWVAGGCSPECYSVEKVGLSPDLLSFAGAFDEALSSRSSEPLEEFLRIYPNSDWAPRAESLIALRYQLDSCLAEKERAAASCELWQEEKRRLLDEATECDSASSALAEQIAALQDDNRQLEVRIEQLKELLIQLEQRPF